MGDIIAIYPCAISYDATDDTFMAVAPDLPGCAARGTTRAEAMSLLQEAIIDWINEAMRTGSDVPMPRRH